MAGLKQNNDISLFTTGNIDTIMCDFQNPLFQSLEPFADMLRDRLAVRKPLQFSSRSRSFQSPGFPCHIVTCEDYCVIYFDARLR